MSITTKLLHWSSILIQTFPPKPTILSTFSSHSFSTVTSLPKQIGTHNGNFHSDEALACFLLRRTPTFSHSTIIRTRDPQVLDSLEAVVDVGGVFDSKRNRYDHHQKGFKEVFGNGFGTKLSSAGLVYKRYGKEIIAKELQLDHEHPHVHCLYLAVYKNFIQAIDAVDNGIRQYDTEASPRYFINTSLSSRVARLNLDWTDLDQSDEKENEAFQKAMTLTGNEFLESIHFHAKSWLPARSIVMECVKARQEIDPSGEIMVLHQSCPWKLHIFELEEEIKIVPSIKYVIYEDGRRTSWRVQAVALGPDRFDSRKPLPCEWRGLEGKQLSEVAGIPGCIFTHMSGFIGGNQTYEGALEMARASLIA